MKIEVMIVWPDGFKSSVTDEHMNVPGKVLAQLRRAGSAIPVALSHDLRDLVYGTDDSATVGGVHTFVWGKYSFIAKRADI